MGGRRRRRGTGSIVHRGTGVWVARVSLGVVEGKPIRRERTAATRAEAERALDILRAQLGVVAVSERTTLDAYLQAWLVHVEATKSVSTAVSYRGIVERHISPLLGGIRLERVKPSDVRALIRDRLAAGLSPVTVRGIVGRLYEALQVAVSDGQLARNPAAGIRVPVKERYVIDVVTLDEARDILAAVRGDRHEDEFTVLLTTGMRRGELLGLRQRDIDFEGGTATVRVQRRPGSPADVALKTERSRRQIPLGPLTLAALRRHRSPDPDARVFPAAPTTLTNRFPLLLERAGLRHRRLHDLRHATATLMLAQGTPMRVITDHLGHSTMAVTADLYAAVVPELQRDAVARLDTLLDVRVSSKV